MKIALITHIESNLNNLNRQLNTINCNEYRLYEQEAIKCFTCWRKNSGWLKDIPIYCLCSTKNTISEDTKQKLKLLNVKYIEDYNKDTEKFSSGFLTIPFVGKYFESIYQINENILIKIDLDNFVFKPIPEKILQLAQKKTIVGQYPWDKIRGRITYPNTKPFDTSVIITNKHNNFYTLYYDLCFSDEISSVKEWKDTMKISGEYWLEEFVVDYIYHNKLADIEPLQYYQYGLNYPSINWFIQNNKFDSVFLRHEHLKKIKSPMQV